MSTVQDIRQKYLGDSRGSFSNISNDPLLKHENRQDLKNFLSEKSLKFNEIGYRTVKEQYKKVSEEINKLANLEQVRKDPGLKVASSNIAKSLMTFVRLMNQKAKGGV